MTIDRSNLPAAVVERLLADPAGLDGAAVAQLADLLSREFRLELGVARIVVERVVDPNTIAHSIHPVRTYIEFIAVCRGVLAAYEAGYFDDTGESGEWVSIEIPLGDE